MEYTMPGDIQMVGCWTHTVKFDEARQATAMPDALTLWVSRHILLNVKSW